MAGSIESQLRVRVDGKFFRLGGEKFHPKGVSYGPFAPNARGEPFASPEQTRRDFELIRELGANLLRVYHVPPRWFLDLAAEHCLKLLVDVPWDKESCFLDTPKKRETIRRTVSQAVRSCARHPAVFAFSVVNEIPPDIVRWSGADEVSGFIDELIAEAKAIDPDCLCTFTNYPPTEFLRAQHVDFLSFNVYLHHRQPFENYLARLQMIADTKPLMLGEFGIDSMREGEANKCAMLMWQIRSVFRAGLAGAVVFSFTDDWHKDGRQIEDWTMGLTTADRKPKESFRAVQAMFREAPHFPLERYPKVSVVVAGYNADRTLKTCLDSLLRLNYPDYEIILVDDGSTDTTPQIASLFKQVRYIRHEKNEGLSVARNTGIEAAAGEIVAFTDADCRADEDWLRYLVSDLLSGEFVGIGGHNFLPSDDSSMAATVMVSPGGPAHVMLTDRQAEHIPGCNMAFYKWALDEVGGFDAIFRAAGDDVDICWRLQQRGYKIGFSPAGFVWHYRRSTPAAYLKQQRGYGEAEALLVSKHPEYFNSFGGSIWRGRIYTASKFGVVLRRSIIYRGLFGSGWFQTLYASEPAVPLMLATTLEYHVLVTLPLWILSVGFDLFFPLAVTSLCLSLGVCVAAAAQAELPPGKQRFWSRPLVALLFLLQPIVRGWARYRGRLNMRSTPRGLEGALQSLAAQAGGTPLNEVQYLADTRISRFDFVARILDRLDRYGWQNKADTGWSEFDVEIFGSRWSRLQLTTVAEHARMGKHLFRCRLRTAWSLLAKVALGAMLGFELLVIGLVGQMFPWLWLLLFTVPLLVWFLKREEIQLQRLMVLFLDDTARLMGMERVEQPARAPVSTAAGAIKLGVPGRVD